MALPVQTSGWIIHETTNGFDNLEWRTDIPIPELGSNEVLVRFHAASLNYRDLMVARGQYKHGFNVPIIPGSDGAGEVVALGSAVRRFQLGDRVMTVYTQKESAGSQRIDPLEYGLGGWCDGTLRQYGVFNEEGLMDMPSNLSFSEAGTLACAALTAWNAFYGLKHIQTGDVVLTQGTGGVAMFAIQLALAAGAMVIATTSSTEKSLLLKKVGVHHIINYNEDPSWGKSAKALTPGGEGVDWVIEVGGAATMEQSLNAIKRDGQIAIIGYLGQQDGTEPVMMEAFKRGCIVRGVTVGTRQQLYALKRAIEINNIKPILDPQTFKLSDLKSACTYMWEKRHVGKIVIEID